MYYLFQVVGLVANITVCLFVTGHIRIILQEILEIACTDCSFVSIFVLDIVFLYYIYICSSNISFYIWI